MVEFGVEHASMLCAICRVEASDVPEFGVDFRHRPALRCVVWRSRLLRTIIVTLLVIQSPGLAEAALPIDQSAAAEQSSPPPSIDDPDADPDKLLERLGGRVATPSERLDRIDTALGRSRVFSDLRSLQDSILDSQRPAISFTVRDSTQSDKLDIRQAELSYDLDFSRGRSHLRFGAHYLNFDPASGSSISQLAAGLGGRHRISEIVTVNAEARINRIELTNRDDYTLTYNAYLTVQPNDVIRIYLSAGERTLDNIASLAAGITAKSVGVSIDYTPVDTMRWSLRGAGEFYTDDNSRQSIEAEGVWRVASKPTLEIGGRTSYFQFTKLLNNGYFNPNEYYSGEIMFRLQSSLSKKLEAELTASGGVEHANPGGTKAIYRAALQSSYAVSKHWSLDGSASHFSSRDTGSGGFSRTMFTLGLRYRF